MTEGMRKEIEILALHDEGLNTFLQLQKQCNWTDLMMLYQALLFQTQSVKNFKDAYMNLSLKGPAPQYIVTTQEQIDNMKKSFKSNKEGDIHDKSQRL